MADNNHATLRSLFSDIANSIRGKTEWNNTIIADTFPEAIDKINWDATISDNAQLMNGVIAYGNNGKFVGSIQSKTENDLIVNGPNITVPAGYYGNNATASVNTTTHPKPTVAINISNIVNGIVSANASHVQNTGYVTGNTTSAVTNINIGVATYSENSSINNSNGVVTVYKNSTAGYTNGNNIPVYVGLYTKPAETVFINNTSEITVVNKGEFATGNINVRVNAGRITLSKNNISVEPSNGLLSYNFNANVIYGYQPSNVYWNNGTVQLNSAEFWYNAVDYPMAKVYTEGLVTNSSNGAINTQDSFPIYTNASNNYYQLNVTAGYSELYRGGWWNEGYHGNSWYNTNYYIKKGDIVNSTFTGNAYLETTNDYGFRVNVTIPEGYYSGTETVEHNFTTGIFPAPNAKANSNQMLVGYSLYDEDGRLVTGTMPSVTHPVPNINSATMNTTSGNVELKINHTQPNGYNSGNTSWNNYNYYLGISTYSNSSSVNNYTGVVTVYKNSTSGYTTGNNEPVEVILNSIDANTVYINNTSEITVVNQGQFAIGNINVKVNAGSTTVNKNNISVAGNGLLTYNFNAKISAGYQSNGTVWNNGTQQLPSPNFQYNLTDYPLATFGCGGLVTNASNGAVNTQDIINVTNVATNNYYEIDVHGGYGKYYIGGWLETGGYSDSWWNNNFYIKKGSVNQTSVSPSTSTQTIRITDGYIPNNIDITVNSMSAGALSASGSIASAGLVTNSSNNAVDSSDKIFITTKANDRYRLNATAYGNVLTNGYVNTANNKSNNTIATYVNKSGIDGNINAWTTTVDPYTNGSSKLVNISEGYFPGQRQITVNGVASGSTNVYKNNLSVAGNGLLTYNFNATVAAGYQSSTTKWNNGTQQLPAPNFQYNLTDYPLARLECVGLVTNASNGAVNSSEYINITNTITNNYYQFNVRGGYGKYYIGGWLNTGGYSDSWGNENVFIKKGTVNQTSINPSTSSQTVRVTDGYIPSNIDITINAMQTTSRVANSGSVNISTPNQGIAIWVNNTWAYASGNIPYSSSPQNMSYVINVSGNGTVDTGEGYVDAGWTTSNTSYKNIYINIASVGLDNNTINASPLSMNVDNNTGKVYSYGDGIIIGTASIKPNIDRNGFVNVNSVYPGRINVYGATSNYSLPTKGTNGSNVYVNASASTSVIAMNKGEFLIADHIIVNRLTNGTINVPSGSAQQNTPTVTVDFNNGIINAIVQAKNGTAYRNITNAGYFDVNNAPGNFQMTESYRAVNVGVSTLNSVQSYISEGLVVNVSNGEVNASDKVDITNTSPYVKNTYYRVNLASIVQHSSGLTAGGFNNAFLNVYIPKGNVWIDRANNSFSPGTVTVKNNTGIIEFNGGISAVPVEMEAGYIQQGKIPANFTVSDFTVPLNTKSGGTTYLTNTTEITLINQGQFATGNINVKVNEGAYSATQVTAVNVTPNVTGTITSIATTTQPSGTDGTDYYTIDPGATYTNGNARARINTAGYITAGSKYVSINASVGGGTNYYINASTVDSNNGYVNISKGWLNEAQNISAANVIGNGSVDVSVTGTISRAPVLRFGGVPSGTINAAGGAITTTAPNSGPYITVNSPANTTTTGNTTTITNAGYINETSQVTVTGKTAGAAAMANRYIPIKTGSVTTTNGTATATAGTANASTTITGMETTSTNTGFIVSAVANATGGSASVTASSINVVNGWVNDTTASTSANNATGGTASNTNTQYIKAATISDFSAKYKAQSKPTFSINTTTGIVTASVAQTTQDVYRNVTTGYVGTANTTKMTFTMNASSNTYNAISALGTTTRTPYVAQFLSEGLVTNAADNTVNTDDNIILGTKTNGYYRINANAAAQTGTGYITSGTTYRKNDALYIKKQTVTLNNTAVNLQDIIYVTPYTNGTSQSVIFSDGYTLGGSVEVFGVESGTLSKTAAYANSDGLVTNISNGAVNTSDKIKTVAGANSKYRITGSSGGKITSAGYLASSTNVSNSASIYVNKSTSSVTNQTVTGTISASGANASTSITGMETTSTNTGFIVSASANATSGAITGGSKTAYANVSEGYTPDTISANAVATVANVSAKTASNSNTQYVKAATVSDYSAKYKAQSKPTFSYNATSGILTASVAATSQDIYRNVTTGYVGTANTTKMTFTMNANSNTYNVISSIPGAINTPSGSAQQSKPTFSINSSTGVITASVAAKNGTAYRNVTTAGYLPTSTTGGNFQMTASSNTYTVGAGALTASGQMHSDGLVTNSSNNAVNTSDVLSLTTKANNRYRINTNVLAGVSTNGFVTTTLNAYNDAVDAYVNKATVSDYSAKYKKQSTPSISVAGNGLVTASVAQTTQAVYRNVSEGYLPSANSTSMTFTMNASSNTLQLNTITMNSFQNMVDRPNTHFGALGLITNISNGAINTSDVVTFTNTPANNYYNLMIDAVWGKQLDTYNASGAWFASGTTIGESWDNYYYLKKGSVSSTSVTPYTNGTAQTVTVSDGYLPSQVNITVSGVSAGTLAAGSASVLNNSNGNIRYYRNVSAAGYLATNTTAYYLQLNTKAGGTTYLTNTTAQTLVNAGQFVTGAIKAQVNAGAIDSPSATVNQNNGLVTVYRNVTTAGFLSTSTTSGTLQLTTKTGAGSNYQNNLYVTPYTNGTAQTIMNRNEFLVANHLIVNGVSAGTLAAGSASVLNNSNGNIRYYRNVSAAGYIAANTTAYYLQLNTKAGATYTNITTTAITVINAGQFATGAIKVSAPTGTLDAGSASVLNNSNGNVRYYRNVSAAGYIAANTTAYYLQLNTKAGGTFNVNSTGSTLINAGQFATGAIIAKAIMDNCTYDSANTKLTIPTGLITV